MPNIYHKSQCDKVHIGTSFTNHIKNIIDEDNTNQDLYIINNLYDDAKYDFTDSESSISVKIADKYLNIKPQPHSFNTFIVKK